MPRKKTVLSKQEKILQDTSFFKQIVDQVPSLIVMYNIQTGEYLYVNDACMEVLGYTKEEILKGGYPFMVSLIHPDDVASLLKHNEQALKKANSSQSRKEQHKPVVELEYRMKHKDGTYRYLHTSGTVFQRSADGKVELVINISVDITSRKKAEEKAREVKLDKHISSLVEHMHDDFISLDRKGNYLYVNEQSALSMKRKKNEFYGKNIWELFPQLKKMEFYKKVQKVLKTKKALQYEFPGIFTPGWFSARIYPTDEGVIIYFTDNTERKKTEDALKKSEERLALALEASQMGIWDWDLENGTISWSEQLERLYGLKPDSFTGTFEQYQSLIHPDDRAKVKGIVDFALKTGEDYVVEHRAIWPDGTTHWLLGMGKALYDPTTKKPIRMTGATRNIDDLKRIEQRKDDFISMASHELKTPITSLKIFTQLLRKQFQKVGDEASVNYLEKMDDQINKLTRLVRELLDVSRITAGKLKVSPSSFDLCECTKEIIEYFKETTKQKIVFRGTADCTVFADRDRISQVIINLFTNAIKYSPPESVITISVRRRKQEAVFSIKDEGVGIPKEHLDRIFERFYQVTPAADASVSGLGMGLYICSEIIKLHGGKIEVVSEVHKGSTFSFSLPLQKAK